MQHGEVCEGETFNVTCAAHEVLQVRSARYGRMQLGRCVTQVYGQPCSVDVTAHVDGRCAGRRACALDVISLKEHQSSCSIDLRSYLEVEYTCTSGECAPIHLFTDNNFDPAANQSLTSSHVFPAPVSRGRPGCGFSGSAWQRVTFLSCSAVGVICARRSAQASSALSTH